MNCCSRHGGPNHNPSVVACDFCALETDLAELRAKVTELEKKRARMKTIASAAATYLQINRLFPEAAKVRAAIDSAGEKK